MEFFNNHTKLFTTAFALFLVLTLFVCIMPALNNQRNNAVLPGVEPMSEDAIKGKAIYVENGCVACHTQQVRNIEMDKVWGDRPSIAADYAGMSRTDFWRNTATLMGTERTGPDLISIGQRQPSRDWHLPHLFNPRIVVKESIMPSYPWLFVIKDSLEAGDVEVSVPEEFMNGRVGKVVAKPEALQLLAYLQSLKQTKLPDGAPEPDFLYKRKISSTPGGVEGAAATGLDGAALYVSNCQACHQANGEGLKGAFPPLKGSKIVLDDNPEMMLNIIMKGYNAENGYGEMPAVGANSNLSADEIAAIMNHERTSWGNNAREVTVEEIKELIDKL